MWKQACFPHEYKKIKNVCFENAFSECLITVCLSLKLRLRQHLICCVRTKGGNFTSLKVHRGICPDDDIFVYICVATVDDCVTFFMHRVHTELTEC